MQGQHGHLTRRHILIGAGTFALTGVAGCLGDGDDEPAPELPGEVAFDDLDVETFEALDRAHGPPEEVAYVHGDHWHGNIGTLSVDETRSVGAHVDTEDGEHLHLGEEYELSVYIAPGSDEEILDLESHGDHVHLTGRVEGITEVVFVLLEDGIGVYQSPPITVQVSGEHAAFDAHHIADVTILDRAHEPHETVATWHDDHWDGALPMVPLDDRISLGGTFEDVEGHTADLAGEYELRVGLAEGAVDIVSFDFHGDHVHIIGEEPGTTQIVFHLWHDDHADFTTEPIEVTVED